MTNFHYINSNALSACQTLHNNGFSAYLVGGCIRDLFLHQTPKDWDIATNALPKQIQNIFEKTYETGIEHGTISVSINNELLEITTFRTEGTYSDGRRPDQVSFVSSIEEDLKRRDFTINAIAYDPIYDLLIDPFNGQDDLEHKIIRCVSDPDKRFQEDGLRLMRAARFAAKLGFAIENETEQAMQDNIICLNKIAIERIKIELEKILFSPSPSTGLEVLFKSKLLAIASPTINEQREKLGKDFFTILDTLPTDLVMMETKLAYLLHFSDIRKEEMKRLKLSHKEKERIDFILFLFTSYLELESNFHQDNGYAARLFLSHIQNESPDKNFEETWQQFGYYCRLWDMKKKAPISDLCQFDIIGRDNLSIKGNDILSLGVSPGPIIKTMLNEAYQHILRFPDKNSKNHLLSFLKEWLIEFRKMN